MKDFRQIKIIEYNNKKIIKNICPDIDDKSGIYIFTREENGFKYAYIGQAKKILTRVASHLNGYQHIDLSLKKHGFYSKDNETGWLICWLHFEENELDEKEQDLIAKYANAGFQLRNKTAGGQSNGKVLIDEIKPNRGYHDGLKQGYKNAQKYISNLFEKNLVFSHRGEKPPTKNQTKALQKFEQFLRKEDL